MKSVEFIREGGFVYFCTEPGDMSGEYIPASYAAEVSRLQAENEAMRDNLKNCIVFLDKIGIDPIKVKREDGIDMLYFGEESLSPSTVAYLKRQRARAALGGER